MTVIIVFVKKQIIKKINQYNFFQFYNFKVLLGDSFYKAMFIYDRLETMCKLDNDLQNIIESVAIPSISKACDDNSNSQNSPLQNDTKNQTAEFFWFGNISYF